MQSVSSLNWFSSHARSIYTRLLDKAKHGAGVDRRYLPFLQPDHPVLLDLKRVMPGTYRHSIMVGSMAAAAGQKVGANPDLIRCLAYYHDIGKIVDPGLYQESQSGERNGGCQIATLEALQTILGHPRQAQFILTDRGFPTEVLIAVAEHHGTIRTRLRISEKLKGALNGSQLHYPGPRPSSRESAIVMLADSSEALLNRLQLSGEWPGDPSRDFIRQLIHRIGGELRRAGQFDEADFSRSLQDHVEGSLMWWMYRYYHELDVVGTPYPPSK